MNPRNGSFIGNYSTGQFYWAYLSSQLSTSINTPGTYSYTSSYAGDANYTGSQNAWPLTVTVLDTTFNISTPVANVTIPAPGQSGMASVTLVGTDNFLGTVNVICALPATMTEATCPSATANLANVNSVTAQLAITTTAPHQLAASRRTSVGSYGFGTLAGIFLFTMSGVRARKIPMGLLLLGCLVFIVSCGGGNGSAALAAPTDPGTPAGTYLVTVSATSSGITRTATFSVMVQ